MGKRIAVIDAGTNTFHLLIAEVKNGEFEELFRKRIFVKLAQSSIEKLDSSGRVRAMDALLEFRKIMDSYQVGEVEAVGTAALRTADNASSFLDEIKELTSIKIQVIEGEDEARLIADGVSLVSPKVVANKLIVDIGGGSVEFIYSSQTKVLFAKSLPIGIAVLRTMFSFSDPLLQEEYRRLSKYLDEPLGGIFRQINSKNFHLIGASGSFETITQIACQKFDLPNYVEIPLKDLRPILNKIIYSTLSERNSMVYLPNTRVDLIIPASILLLKIFNLAGTDHVGISKFAVKEGVLKKYLI